VIRNHKVLKPASVEINVSSFRVYEIRENYSCFSGVTPSDPWLLQQSTDLGTTFITELFWECQTPLKQQQ
jgi:hypothetical protein